MTPPRRHIDFSMTPVQRELISKNLFYRIYPECRDYRIKRSWIAISTAPFRLVSDQLGIDLYCESGLVYDVASIPWLAWQLIGTPNGPHAKYAKPHDLGYLVKGDPKNCPPQIRLNKKVEREDWDELFLSGLNREDLANYRQDVSYRAVQIGGKRLWKKDFDPDRVRFVDPERIHQYFNPKMIRA